MFAYIFVSQFFEMDVNEGRELVCYFLDVILLSPAMRKWDIYLQQKYLYSCLKAYFY